jgi:hypothetical protein
LFVATILQLLNRRRYLKFRNFSVDFFLLIAKPPEARSYCGLVAGVQGFEDFLDNVSLRLI